MPSTVDILVIACGFYQSKYEDSSNSKHDSQCQPNGTSSVDLQDLLLLEGACYEGNNEDEYAKRNRNNKYLNSIPIVLY